MGQGGGRGLTQLQVAGATRDDTGASRLPGRRIRNRRDAVTSMRAMHRGLERKVKVWCFLK